MYRIFHHTYTASVSLQDYDSKTSLSQIKRTAIVFHDVAWTQTVEAVFPYTSVRKVKTNPIPGKIASLQQSIVNGKDAQLLNELCNAKERTTVIVTVLLDKITMKAEHNLHLANYKIIPPQKKIKITRKSWFSKLQTSFAFLYIWHKWHHMAKKQCWWQQ